jgi:hypothetical protein
MTLITCEEKKVEYNWGKVKESFIQDEYGRELNSLSVYLPDATVKFNRNPLKDSVPCNPSVSCVMIFPSSPKSSK